MNEQLVKRGPLATAALTHVSAAVGQVPDIAEGMRVAALALELVVHDDLTAQLAVDYGGQILAAEGAVEARSKPVRAMVQETRDAVFDYLDRYRKPLSAGKLALKKKLDAYRARVEEERQREVKRQLEEAKKSAGDAGPPVDPEMPHDDGVVRGGSGSGFQRKTPPKVRIISIELVPKEFLMLNEAAVLAHWKATGQAVPGTVVYQESETVFRRS
jgi:hypothetical protein